MLSETTSLERNGIGGSLRAPYVFAMPRLIEPVGEARNDFDIFCALSDRLGCRAAFDEGRNEDQWLFDDFPPLKIRPRLDPAQWSWLLSFLTNCNPKRFAENKARMQRVAHRFDTAVRALEADGSRIARLRTHSGDAGRGEMTADAFVLAAGAFAPALLKPLGIHLPVYPVKGYSITAPITGDAAAPLSSVMDEHSKIMVTRLGNRLRAAGVAEIAGDDRALRPEARNGLIKRVRCLFPNACDYDQAEFWCGFRPMTPNGPAKVGATEFANLQINAGHGSNGSTQACGTARILADMMTGRTPDIES